MTRITHSTMKSARRTLTISLFALGFSVVCCSLSSPDHPTQITFLRCLQTRIPQSESRNLAEILVSSLDQSYTSVLESRIGNLRFNSTKTPKPHFIIAPTEKSQVSAAVICCRNLGFELRIRSGGHDYEGVSYASFYSNPFVVLDLFNLNSVRVDAGNRTAYVMAGATVGELCYGIWGKSRVLGFPAGSCPTLGIGGHISGGGYGNLIRKHGLSVDHVIDAEIVNADGEILDRKSMGEDLFWAIRGGGGASFGVLLSYTLNLVPVPDNLTLCRKIRVLDDNATDLVYKWQLFMKDADDDLFIRLVLQPEKKEETETVQLTFVIFFFGGKGKLMKVMDSSFRELGLEDSECNEMGWAESVLAWYGYPLGAGIEALLNRTYKANYLKMKSDYVKDPINKEGLELLWKMLMKLGKPGMVLNPYGGRMNEVSDSETPFPHRAGNLFKIQYSVNWHEGGERAESESLRLMRELYEFMTPYVSKSPRSAFLNYRDLDIGVNVNGTYREGKVYGERYFKANFERLVKVKSDVDAGNFFKYEQSVPVLKSLGEKRGGSSYHAMSCANEGGMLKGILFYLYLLVV